jgi:hypothetical protein
MPKSSGRVTFAVVRTLGLELPGTEEGTTYGSPALKVNGQMFACIAVHRSAEPDSLALQIPFDQRDELIKAAPDTYYVTDHYVDYPMVLVRMSRIHCDALEDLLRLAHRFVSTQRPKRRAGRRVTTQRR